MNTYLKGAIGYIIGAAIASACSHAQVGAIKTVQWGLESWTLGQRDFTIQFYEPTRVYLVAIEGNITASPLAGFNPADMVVRQSLVTIVPTGTIASNQVKVIASGTPSNHGVAEANLAAFNVKQIGSSAPLIPVALYFTPAKPLPMNQLTLHVDNASFRCGVSCYSSTNQMDAIDVEWQVTVTYKVGP